MENSPSRQSVSHEVGPRKQPGYTLGQGAGAFSFGKEISAEKENLGVITTNIPWQADRALCHLGTSHTADCKVFGMSLCPSTTY